MPLVHYGRIVTLFQAVTGVATSKSAPHEPFASQRPEQDPALVRLSRTDALIARARGDRHGTTSPCERASIALLDGADYGVVLAWGFRFHLDPSPLQGRAGRGDHQDAAAGRLRRDDGAGDTPDQRASLTRDHYRAARVAQAHARADRGGNDQPSLGDRK